MERKKSEVRRKKTGICGNRLEKPPEKAEKN